MLAPFIHHCLPATTTAELRRHDDDSALLCVLVVAAAASGGGGGGRGGKKRKGDSSSGSRGGGGGGITTSAKKRKGSSGGSSSGGDDDDGGSGGDGGGSSGGNGGSTTPVKKVKATRKRGYRYMKVLGGADQAGETMRGAVIKAFMDAGEGELLHPTAPRLLLSDQAVREAVVRVVAGLVQDHGIANDFKAQKLRGRLEEEGAGRRTRDSLWHGGDFLSWHLTTLTGQSVTLSNGLVALVAFASGKTVDDLHDPAKVLRDAGVTGSPSESGEEDAASEEA